MAFNSGAPFGAPAQPAFGQAAPLPQPANPFGQAAAVPAHSSAGKITFGAAARTSNSSDANTALAPAFGSSFGSGTGFGNIAGQSTAFGSITNAFANTATPQQGVSAAAGGFGAAATGHFGSQPTASQPAFGQAQPSQAQPSPSNPFARLGNAATNSPQNGPSAQPFSTSTNAFATSSAQAASHTPLFGQSMQQAPSTGFGNMATGGNPFAGTANGKHNPFAAAANSASTKAVAFGRAANKKPQQQQQSGSGLDSQPQQQELSSTGMPSPRVSTQPAKQKQKPQSQIPSNVHLDPAALAVRNARFASKQAQISSPAGVSVPDSRAPFGSASSATVPDQRGAASSSQPNSRQAGTAPEKT